MSGALLSVQNLFAGYGSGDILQGVNLEILPGEMVATIGRNGVGKSTLMKTIIGLLSTRTGSIYLRGESVTQLRADQRAALGIGYVPQGREIFPELTVEENLMMGETINRAKEHFVTTWSTSIFRSAGTATASRRDVQWRSTADVGDWPRACRASKSAASRRTLVWGSNPTSFWRSARLS